MLSDPLSFSFLLQELLEGLSQATPTLDDHSMFSSSGSVSPDLEDTVSYRWLRVESGN